MSFSTIVCGFLNFNNEILHANHQCFYNKGLQNILVLVISDFCHEMMGKSQVLFCLIRICFLQIFEQSRKFHHPTRDVIHWCSGFGLNSMIWVQFYLRVCPKIRASAYDVPSMMTTLPSSYWGCCTWWSCLTPTSRELPLTLYRCNDIILQT